MSEVLLRQWQMLALLPRAPRRIGTAELAARLRAEGFPITQRTIQRDLQSLAALFPLECDDRTKPFGWAWARDAAAFDLPGMDLHVALAFRVAADHLERLLPPATLAYLRPHLAQARARLAALSGGTLETWPDKVRVVAPQLPRRPPALDPAVLEAVQTALLEERRLDLTYRRRGERARKRYPAHPLALVWRDQVGYLVCTLRDYQDPVRLALHRIQRAAVLPDRRRVPPGFTLEGYLASGAFGYLVGSAPVALAVRLDPEAAATFEETPLADDQRLRDEPDGRVLLEATVPDTRELRTWLRGLGELAEVVAPAALRDDLAAEAARVAARAAAGTAAAPGVSQRTRGASENPPARG